jgi:hypothetical protein
MSRVDVVTPAPVVTGGVASRAWHAVLAAVVTASMVVQIVLIVHGGTDVNTVTSEGNVGVLVRLVRLFSYFTIQSNLLVLALAVSLVLNPARDGRLWRVVSADALLGIAVTGLVFGTVLARLVHPTGIAAWVNAGFHYFSPAATVLGWLLFGPRPRMDWATIGWLFAWPVLWIAYTFAHGAATGWYPYPFLDAHVHGYAIAVRNTAAVLVIAVVLVGIFRLIDKHLPAISRY